MNIQLYYYYYIENNHYNYNYIYIFMYVYKQELVCVFISNYYTIKIGTTVYDMKSID